MVNKQVTKQPKAQVEITITAPWADITSKWDETLSKLAAEVEISGFRKGQAPLPMVEGQLGGKLQDEFFKVVFPQALMEAMQGTDIVPIDYPKYNLISFSKGQPLVFKATVIERPIVKVGDYKKIVVRRPQLKTVTDADVENLVNDLFKRWSARQSSVVSHQSSDLPAGGQGVQDQKSAVSNQPSGSLNFNSSVNNSVSSTQPAAPTDDFAKAVGAISLSDLRTKLKADLEAEAKTNNELDFEEEILQEVEKITTVDLPDILIEDELNRMLVTLQRRVSEMGLLVDDYLKSQNKTVDSIKAEWKPQAEKNVRMELGLAEVARLENVTVLDEELHAEINKITDAKLKAQFEQQEPQLHLRHSLRQIKTLDLLKKMVAVI